MNAYWPRLKRRARSGVVRYGRAARLLPSEPLPVEALPSLREWAGCGDDGASVTVLANDGGNPSSAGPLTLGPRLERLESAATLPRWTPFVAFVPGGAIASTKGVVLTRARQVFLDTTWDGARLMEALSEEGRLPRRVPLSGRIASLVSPWWNNFYHWMLDAVPRIALLERAGVHAPLLVPHHLTSFQEESLDILQIGRDRRRSYVRPNVTADMVIWPSYTSWTGHPEPWVCDWLRTRMTPPHTEAPSRRLYVSRALVSRGHPRRRIANEHEVVALLARWGFEIVYPERLTLREQVAAFSRAAFVVGSHGAAHVNTLFSSRLSLLEFFEPTFSNACNLRLARACDHDYWYLVGSRVGQGDIRIPLDLLEASVSSMTEGHRDRRSVGSHS